MMVVDDDGDEYSELYPEYVDETKQAWLREGLNGLLNSSPDAATRKRMLDWLNDPNVDDTIPF
jgi:hypothetical protein